MGIIAETWTFDERVQVNVRVATGLTRLRGLIGRMELPPASGMAFDRCRCVHGIGMTRPLDVVFIDSRGRVVSVRRLRPFALVFESRACWALEMRAGEAGRLGLEKKVCRKGVNRGAPTA